MSYVTNELVSTLQDVKTFQYLLVFQILHVYCTSKCQKVSGYSNKIHVLLMTPKSFIDIPISSYFIVMALMTPKHFIDVPMSSSFIVIALMVYLYISYWCIIISKYQKCGGELSDGSSFLSGGIPGAYAYHGSIRVDMYWRQPNGHNTVQ